MSRTVEKRSAVKPTPIEKRNNINVCAYCRVSNDKLEDSLEVQKAYFEKLIKSNDKWNFVGIYHDDFISGTTIDKRPAFKQMLNDCDNGKIDFIITKEVSRFSRNLKDVLNVFSDLAEKGIFIKFEADGLCTQNPRDLDYLRRSAEQAEYEVRRTSSRVIFNQTFKVENGIEFGHSMLGYKPMNGKMQIVDNPEEIEIIRYIFTEYANGKGSDTICKEIKAKHPNFIPEYVKNTKLAFSWTSARIRRILKNEKYVGDFIFRKHYIEDPLTHKIVKNNLDIANEKRENRDQIYIKNNHEAIIDRETWDKVQARFKNFNDNLDNGRRERHTNRYWASGKLRCEVCGAHFVSTQKKLKNGELHHRWRCYENSRHGKEACASQSISNKVLEFAMCEIVNSINVNKKVIKAEIEKEIATIKKSDVNKITKQLEKLKKERQKKQSEFNALNTELAKLEIGVNLIVSEFEKELTKTRIESYKEELSKNFVICKELNEQIKELEKLNVEEELISEQENFKKMLDEFFEIDVDNDNRELFSILCKEITINSIEKTVEFELNNFPIKFKYQYKTSGALKDFKVDLELIN